MISSWNQFSPSTETPTIWGLDPVHLHDRFWAARGVQVVRQGEQGDLMPDAELYLLTDRRTLTIFRMGKLVDTLSWLKPKVMFIRLHSTLERGYREIVETDESDRFIGFRRLYTDSDSRIARVAVTPYRDLAQLWQTTTDSSTGWRLLRRHIARQHRTAVSLDGSVYDQTFSPEVMQFVRELVHVWRRPDATIARACRIGDAAWRDVDCQPPDESTRFFGPVWVGAGRTLQGMDNLVGPAVLWDDPDARPDASQLQWKEIEPSDLLHRNQRYIRLNRVQRFGKRAFDIAFAMLALLCSLPLYPFIMLAIWLEDGRPFFFGHRRETMGGQRVPVSEVSFDAEECRADQGRAGQAQHGGRPAIFHGA